MVLRHPRRSCQTFLHWFSGSRESLEDLLTKLREQNSREASTAPPEDLPAFDTNLVTNTTAQLGATAYLHCRVRNLNNRAVSWVRRRDWHILTSAMFTYTNDERFQVIHQEGSDDWTLQIKYVQKRDQGAYECQVATGKGTLSHFFNLSVLAPTAYILGTGEYHIGQGSTISLVCIIENNNRGAGVDQIIRGLEVTLWAEYNCRIYLDHLTGNWIGTYVFTMSELKAVQKGLKSCSVKIPVARPTQCSKS
ncbi:unnamed protein product [Nesidiocoris tenuis]|uniref:Ig-like domain-containing protein n=1 Tax=Nesidiocoris tenuis TaxID=355587 RepID=A0A6H5H4A9_9HEMI|nr:unnamed protein product [Nesidiocoris tenuis]